MRQTLEDGRTVVFLGRHKKGRRYDKCPDRLDIITIIIIIERRRRMEPSMKYHHEDMPLGHRRYMPRVLFFIFYFLFLDPED